MPFEFNGHTLDVERGELHRGCDEVHLQPKHLELLVYLIENRDRVVSRKDIFDAVWPRVAVSEAAMSSAIRDLRIALADRDPEKWAIRTFARRGFRFVADVKEIPPPSAPRAILAVPLYGRDAALEQLRAAHSRATSGVPQLVLLLGDPGMGKTACAGQASNAFSDARSSVHHAWCRRRPGGPDFWPFIQWLRSMQRAHACREARSASGAPTRALDACLGQLWSGGEGSTSLAPRDAAAHGHPFRLFDAVTACLEAQAERSTLALFIDDLDAAPELSLELIEFVLRELSHSRLLLVASIRPGALCDGARLVECLEEWIRHIECTRIFLGSLSACDIQEWLDDAGCKAGSADAREMVVQTAGNPLWIQQWVAAAKALGARTGTTPSVVADLALARLAPLRLEDRRVLRAAAVVGNFNASDLMGVAGVQGSGVDTALAQALRRYVVVRTRGTDSTLAFATPLYAELLLREATQMEREIARNLQRGIPQESPVAAQVRHAPRL